MRSKDTRPKLIVTEDEAQEIQAAARQVWNEIAHDIFQSYEDCGEKTPDSLPRSHVMELVMDANRLDQCLKRRKKLNPELVAKIAAYSHQIDHIVKKAFPYARYA